tara:strand:- start:3070 stop:4227 length:1158 start_codon:yes stop_codon:yes gene_type:complete
MAYYSIFPEIDSTIYSHPDRTFMNTGKDEILELVKERGTTNSRHYPSRILIKFKNDEIKSVISDTIGSAKFNDGTTKANLQLATVQPQTLTTILNIEAFAVSQSWHEGSGRYSNLPTSSNGVTWKFRDNNTTQSPWPTSSFQAGTTGSIISGSGLEKGGGSWYTGSGFNGSQQFLNSDSLDINMDVTSIVQKHSASLFAGDTYPTGVTNNGFVIKHPDSVEENTSSSFGEMQYFSVDTHTIYPPKLCFKWDDSVHTKQSVSKKSGSLNVTLYKNKQEFNQNDEALLRIHVRDKYPTRTFSTTSNFLNVGYFTTSSFYSVRDAYTEEEVIPFDNNFTKMSADSEGMYFKLYMKGLQPERYYRILFKNKNNDGTTIYDDDYHFKVVR